MSSRSLNKVLLIGNLTHDPELRYTPQGTAVCTFSVATNRSWTDSSGQQQEEAEFHRIVSWQKLAEICSQLLFKGRKVFVEGRLQTRKWTGQDSQERETTEIVIDNMLVLDSKHRKEGRGYAKSFTPQTAAPATAAGAGKPAVSSSSADDDSKTVRPSDDSGAQKPEEKKEEKPEEKEEVKKEDKKAEEASAKKPAETKKGKSGSKNEEVKAEDIPF